MENKELQNNDFILPGNLGTVRIGNSTSEIITMNAKAGNVTITLKPMSKQLPPQNKTEDAIFEIIQPFQLPNAQPKE